MTQSGFSTPQEAEQAFYEAFENYDLAAMMTVWADREFIECIHPMGDRTQGPAAVADGWRRIFESGRRIKLELSNVHRTQDALLAVHIVYEHFSIPGRNEQYPPVIATNIYQLLGGSWHMVLHHASPSPAEEQEEEDEMVPESLHGERLH